MRVFIAVVALCSAVLASEAQAQYRPMPYRYPQPRAMSPIQTPGYYSFQQIGPTTYGYGPSGTYMLQQSGNTYSGFGPNGSTFNGGRIGNYSYGNGSYGSYSGWRW